MAEVDSSSGIALESNRGVQDELVQFWRVLWRGRWILSTTIVACAALATVYALLAPPWYRSEALLIPANPKSSQGLSGQLASFGGLAGLAGLNILGSNNTSEPLAVLHSRDLIREFIQKNNLLPILFAKKWDASARRWKDARPDKQPDLRDGIKFFLDNVLTVQDDKKTGLVRLAVEWTDPSLAADWANQLIDRTNELMRERAIAEAGSNIAYLQNQVASTTQASLQQAASRLLENELQKAMIARGNNEYAFRVVDRPDVPKRRSRPNRKLTVALGFLAGGIIGALIVFVRAAFKTEPRPASRGFQ